ncbi:MAG: beta-propeller fold lactonase family protein [Bryobacteraceae bacterium]
MLPTILLLAALGPELTTYSLDADKGTLTKQASVTLPQNVQEAWPHPKQRILYVTWSNNSGKSTDRHGVTAFQVNKQTGALQQLGQPITLPARSVFITVDHTGQYLIAAYNQPSKATVHKIAADGTLGAEVPQAPNLNYGIYAHQVRIDPSNRMVIIPARGNAPTASKPEDPGSLQVYKFENGKLTNLPTVAPNKGFNFQPRHLDFHPKLPLIYLTLERQNKLQVYRIAGGPSLEPQPLFTKETLKDPAHMENQATSAIHFHPNGRFVYLGNRATSAGGENSIAVYSVDPKTGEPTLIQNADTHGIHPRTFTIDPSGKILIVANMSPGSLSLFRIQPDGKLDFLRKYDQPGKQSLFWTGVY